ncbi:heat stress transcription factor A-4b [Cocos nucifera]|uniref:Heat stress transcription factor A-4b n=1 Tax=Cocos nucifera TaxID=13894 RepID=A0A8K0IUM2_COCNU|nr:heat stress transcription factor A-4b [Cocos nucifera]
MEGSQGGPGSNSPAPFLTKTYDMVDDPSTNSIVSWSPSDTSFIVWNPLEFARDLLPKYFKHNNFSSFVRQLNTYGFRKIDPDQWEFSNEEFIRGQSHLLKNIHRRKPIHSHSLHHQGNSGPLAETERHELEEEIERIKHEKLMLISELQKHTQQQHGMEQQMQTLEERLHVMEHHQRSMLAVLTEIIQRPGFHSNFVQQSEFLSKKRRLPKTNYFYEDANMEENRVISQSKSREKSDIISMHLMDIEPFEKMESSLNLLDNFFRGQSEFLSKKRRLPKTNYFYEDANMEENRVISQSKSREKSDIVSMHLMDIEPFEKMESSLNLLDNFFRGVSQASGEDMYFDRALHSLPSGAVLTEMNASSEDTDVNLPSPSPKLPPSSPHLGDIHSSPELTECTSYAESPALPLTEIQTDIRSKVSEIDVNSEPAAHEVDSSRDTAAGAAAFTVPTGVNDVFWEQFLTETPGSSDTQEVQSERRDTDDRTSEGKMGQRGNIWWSRKNIDHLAEKIGHLTSAEKT